MGGFRARRGYERSILSPSTNIWHTNINQEDKEKSMLSVLNNVME